ncbi:hypothetical protein ACHAPY_011589 [Fusarium culmorum]
MSHSRLSSDSLQSIRRNKLPDISDHIQTEVDSAIFENGRSSSWRGRGDILEPSRSMKEILNWVKPVPSGSRGLDRDGFPLYVELVFRSGQDMTPVQGAVEMVRRLGISDKVLQNLVNILSSKSTMNQVWIPADLSHPHGWFFSQLGDITHPHRLKGLLINLMGSQNAIMCKACIRSVTTNISWNLEHYMYPFHACKSLAGVTDGKCGCCVWKGDVNCEWTELPSYIPTDPKEGTLGYSLQGHNSVGKVDPKGWSLDQMNPQSAPRLAFNWPVLRLPGESTRRYNSRVNEAADEIAERIQQLGLS